MCRVSPCNSSALSSSTIRVNKIILLTTLTTSFMLTLKQISQSKYVQSIFNTWRGNEIVPAVAYYFTAIYYHYRALSQCRTSQNCFEPDRRREKKTVSGSELHIVIKILEIESLKKSYVLGYIVTVD